MKTCLLNVLPLTLAILAACNSNQNKDHHQEKRDTIHTTSGIDTLPPPYATEDKVTYSKVIGWPEGKTPVAPAGFEVVKFAEGLKNPRWIYISKEGDIFVSEANTEASRTEQIRNEVTGKAESQQLGKSANRITLLRDNDLDGRAEFRETFLTGLEQPFGMLILNDYFYVAATDGLYRFPYRKGQTKLTDKGEKLVTLYAGGYNNHWTRNIIADRNGSKIYISVGSASNVGEYGMNNEVRRANILEVNPDGSGERIFASGLRNPVGMDWHPETGLLWTSVNERDRLGDGLVPDYLTSVREGGFYGWPYSYLGQHKDPSFKGEQRPDLIKKAIVPDFLLGAHTASLGLKFYDQKAFPERFHNGAFVGQHGSWNSSELVGYKVIFIPFKNGKPSGPQEDFLTGFIAGTEGNEVYGRPVGVFTRADGSLLVTDDASNTIWCVRYKK